MHCPICKNRTEPLICSKEKTYRHCPNCDYIFLHPSLRLSETQEKAHYQNHENSIENEGYVQMFEHFLTFILPRCEGIKTVLEFGCGPGPVLAELLRRREYRVNCYDKYFHPEKKALTKEYDLITATEVFEHLADPLKHLALLSALLRPGGYLALMTHFHPQNANLFDKWWYRQDATHIGFFTPATFAAMARECNLEVYADDGEKQLILRRRR